MSVPRVGGVLNQVNRRFSLGGIDLKAHKALKQCAFEMDKCRLLRIERRVRFETTNGFEEGLSKSTVGCDTTHQQKASMKTF